MFIWITVYTDASIYLIIKIHLPSESKEEDTKTHQEKIPEADLLIENLEIMKRMIITEDESRKLRDR